MLEYPGSVATSKALCHESKIAGNAGDFLGGFYDPGAFNKI